jgi:hypothetical protein
VEIWVALPVPMARAGASAAGGLGAAGEGSAEGGADAAGAGGSAPSSLSLASLVESTSFGRASTGALCFVPAGSASLAEAAAAAGGTTAPAAPAATRGVGPRVNDADADPAEGGRLVLATLHGDFRPLARDGSRCAPAAYSPATLVPLGAASAVRHHPRLAQLLVAGFEDGSVALFLGRHALPRALWHAPWTPRGNGGGSAPSAAAPAGRGARVVLLSWLEARAGAFVALDAQGCLAFWDLALSTEGPLGLANLTGVGEGGEGGALSEGVVAASCAGGGCALAAGPLSVTV